MKTEKQLRNKRPVRRAFTLMEIIVVVTIIALLATVIAPRLIDKIGWAKDRTARTNVEAIATAVQLYLAETDGNLTDGFDLNDLLVPAEDGGGPGGPYLDKAEDLYDPWKNVYVIRVPGDVNYDFDIISIGADGQLGTEDDITN